MIAVQMIHRGAGDRLLILPSFQFVLPRGGQYNYTPALNSL